MTLSDADQRARILAADRRAHTREARDRDSRQTLAELSASARALGDMLFNDDYTSIPGLQT